MVWPAHGSAQVGVGAGFWFVVDPSGAVRCGRLADGEGAPGRRTGLDATRQIVGANGERNGMTDYPQRVSDSFYERKRLIRLRRKKENLRFWEEFRIIPRWLTALVAVLYVIALVIAITVNLDRKSTRLNSSHRCISYAV